MKVPKPEVVLDRRGIHTLIDQGHTRGALAEVFQVSRMWLGHYLDKGREPRHPGITFYINWKVKKLLDAV